MYHHCAWWCFVNNKVHWISTWSREYEFRKLFCISHWALSTCGLSPPNYQNWTLCSVSGFSPSSRYWWQFFWGKSQFLQKDKESGYPSMLNSGTVLHTCNRYSIFFTVSCIVIYNLKRTRLTSFRLQNLFTAFWCSNQLKHQQPTVSVYSLHRSYWIIYHGSASIGPNKETTCTGRQQTLPSSVSFETSFKSSCKIEIMQA